MQIREIMTAPAICVSEDTGIEESADLMARHNIGSIPVCDTNGDIRGIVTDRDIVTRYVAGGMSGEKAAVKDIMTGNTEVASPAMEVSDVTKIMGVRQIRRMPVVENSKVVGMVALSDMTQIHSMDMEIAGALSEISEME